MVQMLFIFAFPGNREMYIINILISSICIIIRYLKNMLVFHDLDKMAGSSFHFIPVLLSWNIHWNIRGMPGRKEWGFYDPENIEFGLPIILE